MKIHEMIRNDAEPRRRHSTLPALRVRPWADPVLDRHGHDPRDSYAERFWLPLLGPSAVLLAGSWPSGSTHRRPASSCDVEDAARSLGLGAPVGSPFGVPPHRARLAQFRVVHLDTDDELLVRRRLPGLTRTQVIEAARRRCRQAHEDWRRAEQKDPALPVLRERSRRLALSLLELGESPERGGDHLHRLRFHPSLAARPSPGPSPTTPAPIPRSIGAWRGYSMMTTMSPLATAWPGSTLISATVPALSALMLFSIFMASRTTSGVPTSTAWPTSTSTFTMVPCIGTATLPLPAAGAPPAAAARRGRVPAAAPAPAAATAAIGTSGTHTFTEKRLPSTSTSTSRCTFGALAVLGRRRPAASPATEAGEVEAVLDPLRRVLGGGEVGVLEDGDVGRDRGVDALDAELPQRPQRPGDGDVAVGAPHDELADEVVVVLADTSSPDS